MTRLDDTVNQFEQSLLKLTRQFDSLIMQYQAQIQQQQFEVNKLTMIESQSNNGAVIDLSHQVAQQTVFTSILLALPTGSTSVIIQIGRSTFQIDNPAAITILYPVQYIAGQGDSIKVTYAPLGTHIAYAAMFGYKTGGNQQL